MISLITGIPGSGKSYRAVYEINKTLQENKKNFLIVSNIEGLNIEDNRVIHQDIDNKEFFYKDIFHEYINNLRDRYRLCVSDMIYFYIDEPQRFLPPRLTDEKVFASFEMHRHYGVDIFLITQDKRKIPLPISCLAENEVRAVNPKFSVIPKCFNYNHLAGDQISGRSVLKKDIKIFRLYTSFTAGNPKKYTNPYIIALVVLLLLLFYLATSFIESFKSEKTPTTSVPATSSTLPTTPDVPLSPAATSPVKTASHVSTEPDTAPPSVPTASPPKEKFIVIVDANFARSTFFCDVYGNLIDIPFDNFFRIYSPANYEYSFIKSDGFILLNINGHIHRLDRKKSLFEPLVIKKKAPPPVNTYVENKPPAEEKPTNENKSATLESHFQQRSLYRDVLSHELEKQIFREYIKQ